MDIVWSKQTLELGLFTKDRQQMPIIEGEKLLHLLANLMFFFFFNPSRGLFSTQAEAVCCLNVIYIRLGRNDGLIDYFFP